MAETNQQKLPRFAGWRAALVVALALFAASVLVLIWLRPLMPLDETRYLAVAWEMWGGGSKLVPHLNGEIYSHKPPLLFWLINLVWLVTGVSEFAARLVGPAFGLASVWLTAVLARQLWPQDLRRPGDAALILASSGVFLFLASTTMFDAMLTAGVLVAIIGLVRMRAQADWSSVLVLGAGLALGVLAKGPVALLHILPVAVLMPLWAERESRPALGAWYRGVGAGVLVALVLVGLWLGPALLLGGAEYRHDVLWRQSAGRVVKSFSHVQPFWFYVALIPVFLWPWGWSRAALAALSPRMLWSSEANRFVAVWLLATLIGFSVISGKQPHYLLPEMPRHGAFAGRSACRDLTRRAGAAGHCCCRHAVLFVLGIAVAVGLVGGASLAGIDVPLPYLAGAGLVLVALGLALWRLPDGRAVRLIAAPATLLILHLILSDALFAFYSTDRIGLWLASHEAQGIARVDERGYHGEFSFTGRLARPHCPR